MNTTVRRNYEAPAGVRRSFTQASGKYDTPSGVGRPIRYGDHIFVRLVRMQYGRRTLAELTLTSVNDMSEIYGELRHHTRGERGLATLYVRNVSRGWSMQQPFMLYADTQRESHRDIHREIHRAATSVTRPVSQPESRPARRREIPESIRLLYGEH